MLFRFVFSLLASLFIFTSCLKSKETPPDQLTLETQYIDDILAKNDSDYVVYTITNNVQGIRLAVHSFGEDPIPHIGQTVKFTYVGKLLSNMSVVDTGTYNGVIENAHLVGLRLGISKMPTGSKSAIYIQSPYAYGSAGKGKIPGNASLVYEVHLISTTKTSGDLAQFTKDTAAISKYLSDSNVTNTISHSSGIRYKIHTEGSGEKPKVYDKIVANYKGSYLSNGTVFGQGTLDQMSIFDLIDGLRVGIPLLKTGSVATFYIPSGLAYGTKGSGSIPPNSPLIFEVSLQSFSK